jgi:hypothetical protein
MRLAAELLDGGGDVSAANSSALSCLFASMKNARRMHSCNYVECSSYIVGVVAWEMVDLMFTMYRAKTTKMSVGSSSEQIKTGNASTEQVKTAACSMFGPKLKYIGFGGLITTNRIRPCARRI